MPGTVALYARVSTTDQDPQRQLDELREFAAEEYPDHEPEEFVDIVSGTEPDRDDFDALREEIKAGAVELVVVDEISRLSRLGAGAIHEFIQFCLEHETSIEDREVGLSLKVDDDELSQAIMQTLAGLMGSLAEIEHKQKLRRIRSGIAAAQEAGKWTGRPPRGFVVDDDGYLRVDAEEFLRTRAALERVAAGEAVSDVAEKTGVPSSTLSRLYDERADLYLRTAADDDRLNAALDDLRPLADIKTGETDLAELQARVARLEEQVADDNV